MDNSVDQQLIVNTSGKIDSNRPAGEVQLFNPDGTPYDPATPYSPSALRYHRVPLPVEFPVAPTWSDVRTNFPAREIPTNTVFTIPCTIPTEYHPNSAVHLELVVVHTGSSSGAPGFEWRGHAGKAYGFNANFNEPFIAERGPITASGHADNGNLEPHRVALQIIAIGFMGDSFFDADLDWSGQHITNRIRIANDGSPVGGKLYLLEACLLYATKDYRGATSSSGSGPGSSYAGDWS